MPMDGHGFMASKNTKYISRNPISRYLIRGLLNDVKRLLSSISFERVVEVGCGEGILLHHIRAHLQGKSVVGVDIDVEELEVARRNVPFATFIAGNAYDLPFPDSHFDLVVCCEVLEHLDDPKKALRELRRIATKYCLLSVPNEPFWRLLNMMRGAYIANLGNTPGHVNHWSARGFRQYIGDYFQVLKRITPLPWVAVLCCQERECQTRAMHVIESPP